MLVQHTVSSICVCELNKAFFLQVAVTTLGGHSRMLRIQSTFGAPSKRVKWKTELTHPTVMLPPLHLYCLISVIPHPLMDQ